MSTRHTFRSTRSGSSGSKTGRRHHNFPTPQKKVRQERDQSNDGRSNDQSVAGGEDGSITSSGTRPHATSGDTDAAANNDDDNDDEHGQPDVHALSRNSGAVAGRSIAMADQSVTPAQTPEVEFRTGLKYKTNNDDEMQIDYPQSMKVGSAMEVDQNSDASASCNSDSDSDAEMETDFVIADDDEDYDGVDQVSVASNENVDAAAEEEILANGEQGINWELDWHDGVMSEHNYVFGGNYLDVEDDCEIVCSAMDRRMYPFGRRRRSTAASAKDKRLFIQNQRRVSFADPWAMTAISEAPISVRQDHSQNEAGIYVTATDWLGSQSFKTEEDSTDDEGLNTTVSSPGVALTRRCSVRSDRTLVQRSSHKSSRKQKMKLPVMRKFAFDPNKAVSITTITPDGKRYLRFREAESSPVKWVMAASSRSKSLINPNARVESVIDSELLQQVHCGNDDDPSRTAESSFTEFARTPFLRPNLLSPSQERNENILADAAEAEALALIDFDGGHSINSSQTSADKETAISDLTIRSDRNVKDAYQLNCSGAPLPSPAESALNDFQTFDPFMSSSDQVMSDNVPFDSMEMACGSSTPILEFTPLIDFEGEDSHFILNTSSPRKRRISTISEACPGRRPIVKRQCAGMFTEVFT